MELEKENEIELEQEYAIIEGFPEDAIDLTIDVDIYIDGDIQKVRTMMDMKELADAIEETRGWYAPGLMDLSDDELDDYEPPNDCLVVSLPVNAVFAKLSGKVYKDNQLEPFRISMDLNDIRRAIRLAEKDYIPSDAKFCLTEKGKALAELLGENG